MVAIQISPGKKQFRFGWPRCFIISHTHLYLVCTSPLYLFLSIIWLLHSSIW
uniref:Uncharacterized protein n=1 Tax=Anguilla anguilla TaxID=7936 RepID=A0A0E9XYP3_ANGAN